MTLLARMDEVEGVNLTEYATGVLKNLQSYLQLNFPGYEFEPMASEHSFRRILSPFDLRDVVEIARHMALMSLATWEVNYKPPHKPLGFIKPQSQDSTSADEASERRGPTNPQRLEKGDQEQVAYVFPFLSPINPPRRLCEHILLQSEPCMIDISFAPFPKSRITGIVQSLEHSLALCESYLQRKLELELRTIQSIRAQVLSQWFFSQKHLLETPDNAFLARIRIASPNQVSVALTETVGNCITGPEIVSATSAPYLAGGFVSYHTPQEKDVEVLATLATDSEEDALLLHCFDAESAGRLFILPEPDSVDFPGIPVCTARHVPAMQLLPKQGTFMGEAERMRKRVPVYLGSRDHRRHVYIIGQTGVGKTTLILSMVLEHIRKGQGVAILDPHGDLIEQLLTFIPEERMDDVILFDPGDASYPVGLNLIDWQNEDEKSFLVDQFLSMLNLLYRREEMGPMFWHNVRFGLLLMMSNPNDPGTLVEFPQLLTDPNFHKRWLQYVTDPLVRNFWEKEFPKTNYSSDQYLHYVVSKFDPFISHQLMRNIIGQRKNKIHMQNIIHHGNILLVNLSRGKLGEFNSDLLGMIVIAKLYVAAMRRASIPKDERRDFFVYVDEFQNLATDTVAHLLSEARKFRLNLALCNQYIAQLPIDVINAILGNVGTLVTFRVGLKDADALLPYFQPILSKRDLTDQPNFHAYVRLLMDGQLTQPFSMNTKPQQSTDTAEAEQRKLEIRRRSRKLFGTERSEVEEQISASLRVTQNSK